jgi:hypothetical protein
MTHRQLSPRAIVPLALLATMIGCGKTATTTGPTAAVAIASVTPSAISPSSAPQLITIGGSGFETGLTVSITAPGGAVTILNNQAVSSAQATSFNLLATFATSGTYSIVVQNPDGSASAAFQVVVGAGGSTVPVITSVSPSSATSGSVAEPVTISGQNFSGLQSVRVVAPDGTTSLYSGGQISETGGTTIQLNIVFSEKGQYTFYVLDPSGTLSNSVLVNVQ